MLIENRLPVLLKDPSFKQKITGAQKQQDKTPLLENYEQTLFKDFSCEPWEEVKGNPLVLKKIIHRRFSKAAPSVISFFTENLLYKLYQCPSCYKTAKLAYLKNRKEVAWMKIRKVQTYKTPAHIQEAIAEGKLVSIFPYLEHIGFVAEGKEIGQYVLKGESKAIYYSITPQTLGLLIMLSSLVQKESGNPYIYPVITSLVRDEAYQKRLLKTNWYGARESLHTTGLAFDVDRVRSFKTDAEKEAWHRVLSRLASVGMIYFAHESNGCTHVSLNPQASLRFKTVFQSFAVRTDMAMRKKLPVLPYVESVPAPPL